MHRHIDAMQLILNGELDQMSYNYSTHMTQADYFHEITGKTAELFRLSFEQGAILTNAPESIIKLGGRLAFELVKPIKFLTTFWIIRALQRRRKSPC